MEIEPGTPVAHAVRQAKAAARRGDRIAVDAAYHRAVTAAGPGMRAKLEVDHCARLLELGATTTALRRCTEYLDHAPGVVALLLLRAQVHSSAGDHADAMLDVEVLRGARLTTAQRGRLARVTALAALDRGYLDEAERWLDTACQCFRDTDDQASLEVLRQDRLLLGVRGGVESAVTAVLTGPPPRTTAEHLLRATALKRELRYEQALHVLLDCVFAYEIEPVLRRRVLYELISLLVLTRHVEAARDLFPLLVDAMGRHVLASLPDTAESVRFDRRLDHCRRLIADGALVNAEELLLTLRDTGEPSLWHLAAGELAAANHEKLPDQSFLHIAIDQFTSAVEHADTTALGEVRVLALRLLGNTYWDLDADEQAEASWAQAHRIEERIAARQETDHGRVRLLLAAPTEHDARVLAAERLMRRHGPVAVPSSVVALEAARGAAILNAILPDGARDLARLQDFAGARRWLHEITRGLPRSQVVWLLHATPDRLHHAIVGRRFARSFSTAVDIGDLTSAVDSLMACWDPMILNHCHDEFEMALTELSRLLDIGVVLGTLPDNVDRIAVVAGDVLADIPLAGLPVPGSRHRFGDRYALSSLPCLSALRPLHDRSVRQRGDTAVLLSPDPELTPAAPMVGRTVLTGATASPARLDSILRERQHRVLRIDAHGGHDNADAARSWLQLANGRVYAETVQWMDFSACGTVVLGACESGMAQRKGRDERIGFARAAVRAGAAAVVAARWVTEDTVAARLLDRFEHNLRYLPRDVALQRAQRVVSHEHPAIWACWTLYGDSGRQTRAGLVRRLLRGKLDERRHGARRPSVEGLSLVRGKGPPAGGGAS